MCVCVCVCSCFCVCVCLLLCVTLMVLKKSAFVHKYNSHICGFGGGALEFWGKMIGLLLVFFFAFLMGFGLEFDLF